MLQAKGKHIRKTVKNRMRPTNRSLVKEALNSLVGQRMPAGFVPAVRIPPSPGQACHWTGINQSGRPATLQSRECDGTRCDAGMFSLQ
ncbi:hypothetical protein GCM10011326_26400 [Salipiger profundus]|nr:hypothetical protein GCM10011326_26400 [Salipiger profundus]